MKDKSNCIAIASLVISVITLCHTCKVERKNDQHFSVTNLVEYINEMQIGFSFYGKTYIQSLPNGLNLFQMSNNLLCDDSLDDRVFFLEMRSLPINFGKYISDPNMPKDIVDNLRLFEEDNFVSPGIYLVQKYDEYVQIYDRSDLIKFQFQYPDSSYFKNVNLMSYTAVAYQNFESFVLSSIKLKESIKKWGRCNNVRLNLNE